MARFVRVKTILEVPEPEELLEVARQDYGMEGDDLADTVRSVFRLTQCAERWEIAYLSAEECEEPPL